MLESYLHKDASFITLTYKDEDLPYDLNGQPTLCKRDLQLFLKRLRKRFGNGVRFYAVGEYGEKYKRPHYHCIVFGVSPDALDPYWLCDKGKSGADGCYCHPAGESPLSRIWQHGIVHTGECTRESIQYVAGYVLKKFVKKGDVATREFSLMSRRPGIGAGALKYIVAAVKDVADAPPRQLRMDNKLWPIGRFLLGKLSEELDYKDGPDVFYLEMVKKFQEFRKSGSSDFFVDWLVGSDDQKFKKLDARASRYHLRDFE